MTDDNRPLRTVLLIDDHEIVRQGLRNLLERSEDLVVGGEAVSVVSAIALVESVRADVLLIDLKLPDGDGLRVVDAAHRVQPQARTLILSGFADPVAYRRALRVGVDGYILKEAAGSTILDAIRRIADGERVFAAEVLLDPTPKRRSGAYSSPRAVLPALGPREQQVLGLIAEGKLNKEIADELSIAEKSVRNITTTLFRKLGVTNRTEAALRYRDGQDER
jgi:two-component system, NarL family, response regulator DevR